MGNTSIRWLIRIVIVIFMFNLVFVFFVGFVYLGLKYVIAGGGQDFEYSESESGPYQHYVFSGSDDTLVSSGFISGHVEFTENDVMSYHDESDNLHLISRYSSPPYKCIGTCFCAIRSERRISSFTQPLSKGVTYFVVAISSTFAYTLARNHFQKNCEEEFSETCDPLDSIQSEVTECKSIVSSPNEEEDEKEDDSWIVKEKDQVGDEILKQFMCQGHCLMLDRYEQTLRDQASRIENEADQYLLHLTVHNAGRLEGISRNFGCESLRLTKMIRGKIDVKTLDEIGTKSALDRVRWEFITENLHPFCKEKSKKKVPLIDPNQREATFESDYSLCNAWNSYQDNPTARCIPAYSVDLAGDVEQFRSDPYHPEDYRSSSK